MLRSASESHTSCVDIHTICLFPYSPQTALSVIFELNIDRDTYSVRQLALQVDIYYL